MSIQDKLEGLSEEEKKYVLSVLRDMDSGNSKSFTDLMYEDYNEIPVDIETFITDDNYMGQAWKDAEGKLKLYPFWLDKLKELFPNNTDVSVNNFIESGARGLGKSENAIVTGQYLMYRVLCMKNPLEFFHMKPTEKICFAFMNITKDLSEEIGVDKFQKSIQKSPWFMARGRMTTKDNEPYWVPPEPIDIIIGSQASHVIGQPIFWCLSGDTVIKTTDGDRRLDELVEKDIKVISVSDSGDLIESDTCTVFPTKLSKDEYKIELEDGSILHCTPEHRFMLIDGTYKQAKDLSLDDELMDFKPYGYVYKTTNRINGKIYIGQKQSSVFLGNKYLGSGSLIKKAINKYGCDNFNVDLIEFCVDKQTLDSREKFYIKEYCSTDISIGYNIADGGQGGNLGETVNKRISDKLKGVTVSETTKIKISDSLKKKHIRLSDEQKKIIGEANKGKVLSKETRQKISSTRLSRTYTYKAPNKNKISINNGETFRYICSYEVIPDGWSRGIGKTKPHDMSHYYNDSNVEKRKANSASKSGEHNSMYGNGYRVSGGKNGKATIDYYFDGMHFECRKHLLEYLKENVDNTISESCIRSIVNGTYGVRIKNKYSSIIEKLSWESKK